MSGLSLVGAIVLMLVGLGLGVVALSVGYLGSFSGSGLARPDSFFVTCAAVGNVVCIGAAIALFYLGFQTGERLEVFSSIVEQN